MSDRYARERFSPKVRVCRRSILSLHFNGQRLQALGSMKMISFSAVSGRTNDGKFDYSSDRQHVPDQGPIPAGEYWIQLSELQENAWYRLRNPRFAWGDYWITIHPYPSTETFKRGGFFIHGGSTPGSAGCIDLSLNMNRFVAALADELKDKGDCYIPLTVRYTK
ncbi:MAG: DUF2778 domain-containing protein [Burkholderiales bacterium]|nr:DUF2778 domain-containing protein [Burkholderiales bacterium]